MSIDNPPKNQPHRKGPERGGRTKGEKKGNQPIVDAEYIVLSNKNEGIPAPDPDIVTPNSRLEVLKRLREKVTAVVGEVADGINQETSDNGMAEKLRSAETELQSKRMGRTDDEKEALRLQKIQETGDDNAVIGRDAAERARDMGLQEIRKEVHAAEDAYFVAYTAYHKAKKKGFFAGAKEKAEMLQREEIVRKKQRDFLQRSKFAATLSGLNTSERKDSPFGPKHRGTLDGTRIREKYKKLVDAGEVERNENGEPLSYEKWRASQVAERYARMVGYLEVTKPFIVRKQRAQAEALESKKVGTLRKAGKYFLRKSGELNSKVESSIVERIIKNNGAVKREQAEALARVAVRSMRLIMVSAVVGAVGAVTFGVPTALALTIPNIVKGVGRIVIGAGVGYKAGSFFAKYGGAWRRNKKTNTGQKLTGSKVSSKDFLRAEKYAVLGTDEDIAKKRKIIELGTAALTSLGLSAYAAHEVSQISAVTKAVENVKDIDDKFPAQSASIPGLQEASPDKESLPAGESVSGLKAAASHDSLSSVEAVSPTHAEGVLAPEIITAEPNDGPDVMFRKLKLSLAEQYKDVPNPPADVQEILDTNEHLLSRRYGLAWNSKMPGAWDDGRTLYVGDTFELKDGKIILTHNGNAEVLEAGAKPPVSEVSSSPVTQTETPSAPVEVERPQVTVPAETPLQGAPGAEAAPESVPIVEPASMNTSVHAATSLGSTASHTADGAVISTAAEATPAKVVAGIAPSKYNVPWAIPGETKSPFTNQLGTFVDPVTPHVYADGRSNVYVYGGSFDEQRRMASEYALKHPNTIVRYEGRPFEQDGVLKRWTATALSDGDKVFNPDKPTAASEIGTTPDRSYFTKRDDAWLVKKPIPVPVTESKPEVLLPTESKVFWNGKINVDPNTPHVYKGPNNIVFASGGDKGKLLEMAQDYVIKTGQPVYMDASYVSDGELVPRVRMFDSDGRGGITMGYVVDKRYLLSGKNFNSIIE